MAPQALRATLPSEELPRWFTPKRMLWIFTGMSVIVYLDRGLIGSTPVNGRADSATAKGTGIQGDFQLSNFQDGCLPAAFMVGLLVACPIFVHLAKTVQQFKLVGVGLLIWFLSVFASGLTWDFWSLLFCRTAVGAGEASFVILAAPFIEEYAPTPLKSLWLAIFLMAIPVGYALGYIYGAIVGTLFGWRFAFLSEACIMLPFVVFSFLTKPVPLGKGSRSTRDALPELASSPLRSTSPGLRFDADSPSELESSHPSSHQSSHPLLAPDDPEATTHGGGGDAAHSMHSTQHGVTHSAKRPAKHIAHEGGYEGGLHAHSHAPPRAASPGLGAYDEPREGGLLEAATERMAGMHAHGDAESPIGALEGSGGGDMHKGAPGLHASLKQQVLWMLRQRVYTLTIMGNTMHTALLGMFAYWGPKGATLMFRMLDGEADLVFGVVTVATGILGTLAGGSVLDKLGGDAHAAGKVCFVFISLGFGLLQLGFMFAKSFGAFVVVFALGQFSLFMLQAPMTRIILLSAPVHLQPLAFSIQTISIHVFGDVPSPPLAGWVHDHIFQPDDSVRFPSELLIFSWRWTCMVMVCVLIVAMVLFACVAIMTRSPRSPLSHSPEHVHAPHARSTNAFGPSRPVLDDADENMPPPHASNREDVGSLGLPKNLKDYLIPPASEVVHMNSQQAGAGGMQYVSPKDAALASSSIGHAPGCVDSDDVLLLMDDDDHLKAVDEASSSKTHTTNSIASEDGL